MAVLTFYLLPSVITPQLDVGLYCNTQKRTIDNSAANGGAYPANGDNIQLFTIQRNCRMLEADLKTLATLGATATVKLQRNRSGTRIDLTGATTAGGASVVNSTTIGNVDLLAGDIIELLVGGANISAAAGVEVDLLLQH